MDTLDEISYLDPASPEVISRLRTIASRALCVRYHQNQADEIVMQWKSSIQQLPGKCEREPTKPMRSSKKQDSVKDESVEDMKSQIREMRELLAKLQDKQQENAEDRRKFDQGQHRQEEQARRADEKERRRRKKEQEEREAKRQEEERLEKERKDRERKEQREREQAAYSERLRQRAQKRREERERERKENEQKEKEQWSQLWTKYEARWVQFKSSASSEAALRDSIPWPVKSGSYRDVKASAVEEFFEKAVPKDSGMAKRLRKECMKWHPDSISRSPHADRFTTTDRMMADMICRVVTSLIDSSAGRSAEFL
ncbi:uncharacterized protein LY89DRAFT_597226 [Mollisia scopiformis]|uniref:Uncharacterized protein n=1 Tax=Mollisia scopiformis TaxID=149040 RepID=A0A132BC94_MOLSC|nr:uncharacterized protein LY89DRAFT_597226 [Mollisia scopiformis]KUJ09991.1 hypothetical protein LY89DRAFT_597226 [Mollisia scopiformis]